jgi:hypothetical protein
MIFQRHTEMHRLLALLPLLILPACGVDGPPIAPAQAAAQAAPPAPAVSMSGEVRFGIAGEI